MSGTHVVPLRSYLGITKDMGCSEYLEANCFGPDCFKTLTMPPTTLVRTLRVLFPVRHDGNKIYGKWMA